MGGGEEESGGPPDRSWEEREKTLRMRPDRGTGDRREAEGEGEGEPGLRKEWARDRPPLPLLPSTALVVTCA